MAYHRHRVHSNSKIITLLNVWPTAQQLHLSYLLRSQAQDLCYVLGHMHKVSVFLSFAAIFIHSFSADADDLVLMIQCIMH